ncbi:hypothetical protein GS454_04655 [Rhodococcus hoagii]|nr:hypothetical protein [Prescottella equi]
MKFKIAAAALAAVAAASLTSCAYVNNKTQDCVVTEKDRTAKSGSNSSEMRVYTDCGVFVVEDNFLSGFNSADLYGRIKPGTKYQIESGGVRIGFLSEFPKIINAKEIR